jgi:L-alanine-DL-glutamate epimerase-like enolase superfamily enzyme
MLDANQSWTMDQAKHMIQNINPFNVSWVEEPIAADRPDEEWYRLIEISNMPLAAGENIFSKERFKHLISTGYLGIVQPDLAKWGGLTETVPLAKAIIAAKKSYCPHFLGGGVGLMASAHALAAVGGDGILELDCNPNPLRTFIAADFLKSSMSCMDLGDEPGIGVVPELNAINEYRVQ